LAFFSKAWVSQKRNADSRVIAQTHQRYLWEASSDPYHLSSLLIEQARSSGISKIFMVKHFVILCDDISSSSTSSCHLTFNKIYDTD
jgi:hypothetical protein